MVTNQERSKHVRVKCVRVAPTSNLKTGVLGDKRLRNICFAADCRGGLGKPLSNCKFANRTRCGWSNLHEITHILFGSLGRLLTCFGSCSAASRPTLAIRAAAAVFLNMLLRLANWAFSHYSACANTSEHEAQRKASHDNRSKVTSYRSHGTILAQQTMPAYADYHHYFYSPAELRKFS
jgi:hypothetical protein